jgi:hypothetical protein
VDGFEAFGIATTLLAIAYPRRDHTADHATAGIDTIRKDDGQGDPIGEPHRDDPSLAVVAARVVVLDVGVIEYPAGEREVKPPLLPVAGALGGVPLERYR